MPFAKRGDAPIIAVKCGCGQPLASADASCPSCGKNLRPFSTKKEETVGNATTERLLDSAQQACASDAAND